MNDWTKQYTVGEAWTPNAERLNNGTDVALAYKRGLLKQTAPALQASHQEGMLFVKNNSDADRKEREILGIDSILFNPTENLPDLKYAPCVKGVKPTAADHAGKFVICAEPIAKDAIGLAFFFGVCTVRIGSEDVNANYLDVTDGDATHLSANPVGSAQVLYSASEADANGDYWALVRLANPFLGSLIKLTGTAEGRGIYTGTIATPPTDALDVTSDLTDAQIDAPGSGSGSGGNTDVYLINPGETATPAGSHWLSTSGLPMYFFGIPWGVSDDASGNKPVYIIVDNQFDYCGTAGSG